MATALDPPATSDAAVSPAEPPMSAVPSASAEGASKPSMGSPPLPSENPRNSSLSQPSEALSAEKSELQTVFTSPEEQAAPPSDGGSRSKQSQNLAVPYTIPEWSKAPSQHFFLEVLKDGSIIDQLDITKKGAYLFGRIDLCDFVLEHLTISRFHAVLQFKGSGQAYLYDLGSTHGTFINKNQVNKKVYVELHVGDVIRFGLSSRLYIFQGPTELMPSEADLKTIYYAKDREASLRRAREEAALADGVSWGMREDAVEEAEDDAEEITWQNYKGELTEKQQKTREKVLKRMEKIAHMKKEISAIRAKDIAQGGLTQGQQTQIARNEMRISQIMEELESLEETLNDSIRESIGARAGKSSRGRQRGVTEDEDDLLSDDDEFYDRTKKRGVNKSAETQAVETADSLLDKKDAVMKEMEEKRRLLAEEDKMSQSVAEQDAGDELDAFMSGLSSQLVLDRTVHLEKDLSSLQTELDKILYLLKLADPTGETARKRVSTAREQKLKELVSSGSVRLLRPPKDELKEVSQSKMAVSSSTTKQPTPDVSEDANVEQKPSVDTTDSTESKPAVYQVVKPQWLGAVEDREEKESHQERELNTDEADEFVDYRDRKKILDSTESQPESDLEKAAPGLILRKKKQVEKTEISEDHKPSMREPAAVDMMAEDAVALLLKHKRGLYASDEGAFPEESHERDQRESKQDNKRPRRVLGPEKPAFLETNTDYETWVPPEGQSGDGRTSLNDRLGY